MMKFEDVRKYDKKLRDLQRGDAFEYDSYVYRVLQQYSSSVDMTPRPKTIICENMKSATIRAIGKNEPVRQVHGRIIIERNA